MNIDKSDDESISLVKRLSKCWNVKMKYDKICVNTSYKGKKEVFREGSKSVSDVREFINIKSIRTPEIPLKSATENNNGHFRSILNNF